MHEYNLTDITVIIPTLNEAAAIEHLIKDLEGQLDIAPKILVVDGGSTDGTIDFCRDQEIPCIESTKGRAQQLNAGAKAAPTDLLLFLHADTKMPDPLTLKRALHLYLSHRQSYSGILAGHFPLRFERKHPDQEHKLFWRYAEEKTDTNRADSINGDQGLFIEKSDFLELGGYDESLHFLEDQRISDRIFQDGKWIVLPGHIITSARRFETEGEHRLYILMAIIMGLFKTDFKEFFALAPQLYRQQNQTEKLYLTPFFKLIWEIKIKKLGWKKGVLAWFRVGRYIRSHSWQMFYFFDQLLRPLYGQRTYPLVWFHDHIFEPPIKNSVCDFIVAIVSFIWFMGVLYPFFWLTERRELRQLKTES